MRYHKNYFIPQNAFEIKDRTTKLEDAKPSVYVEAKFNNMLLALIRDGYGPDNSVRIVKEYKQDYYQLYLDKYYPISTNENNDEMIK